MQYEHQIHRMNEFCCSPVYRVMLESVTYGTPSGKHVVFVKVAVKMGIDELSKVCNLNINSNVK
jgi:hypothetical protein